MNRLFILTMTLFLLLSGGVTHATVVTFGFEGVLTYVDPRFQDLFNTSQVLSGTYSFELTTPGVPFVKLGFVSYPAITAATVTLGPFAGKLASPSSSKDIVIGNNTITNNDYYEVHMDLDGTPALTGRFPTRLSFSLGDPTATALSSTNLSSLPPVLSDFLTNSFSLTNGIVPPEESIFIGEGRLTSLTPVPLPPTALLFGSVLAALAGLKIVRNSFSLASVV